MEEGEYRFGLCSASAPVRDSSGAVRYAVGFVGMFDSARSPDFQRDIDLTCAAAAQISTAVSYTPLDVYKRQQQAREVIDTTGGEYYAEMLANKGITYLGSFHNGFRQLTNSKHAVTTPEDLKGLKIRVPGSAVYMGVFKALGASPRCV